MNKCLQCGKCCQAIPFPLTKKVLMEEENPAESVRFILRYWKRVSAKKASVILDNDKLFSNFLYYECSLFNKESGLCGIHNDKPSVCADYPYYGKSPEEYASQPDNIIYSKCGYLNE